MAFHDTTERYRYIYGSNVTRLDGVEEYGSAAVEPKPKREGNVRKSAAEESPLKKNKPADTKKQAAIRRNRERLLEFDWKYTIMTAAAVVICAAAALVYVGGTVRLNHLSAQISSLKTEKAELLSKQIALQTEIDKNINLDEIRTFAEEKLQMTYPVQDRVIYYNDSTSDYFRQYESVDAVK